MREISTSAELAAAAGGDLVVLWAGQGRVGSGVRAWWAGDAVVVAAPELSKHDRLALRGPVEQLVPLVPAVLSEVGSGFRPFGEYDVLREVAARVPGMTVSASFGWMETATSPADATTACWIDEDDAVEQLLAEASPGSYAWPGQPGVLRWAGLADDGGRLTSIAADAWSAPDVGFMAGVATRPPARGQGLSRQVCAFVTAELVKRHGHCALMVDETNAAAIAVYDRLGYRYRAVGSARLEPHQG